MKNSLELYHNKKLIFTSNGHWIHPLFELEKFLTASDPPREELLVMDKIIGRAAALLIIRLGITTVRAEMLSRIGEIALQHHHIKYSYKIFVDKIGCQTENLLSDTLNPQEAYNLLINRIQNQNANSPGEIQ